MLSSRGIRQVFVDHIRGRGNRLVAADDDSTEENEFESGYGGLNTRTRNRRPDLRPKVPSEVGQELTAEGIFGTNDPREGPVRSRKRPRVSVQTLRKEMGLGNRATQRARVNSMIQHRLPSSTADQIIHYDNRCYSGQFSDDGNFFFACAQDFKVRLYDTSNPYDWKYNKTVHYPYGQWTITDATLSPDNKFLAYSSIRSMVCLAPTDESDDMKSQPFLLDFSHMGQRSGSNAHGLRASDHFGIWSLRFSGDGREIVAGTSNHSIYVYDVEARQSTLRIPGHEEDVNAVCFGDKNSPHLLFSGSDDTTLKIWDRRSMGDGREAGVFLGHTEGITYVDSKGDGRYVLSNGKDQSMKLWDIRRMHTHGSAADKFIKRNPMRFSTGFDYRFMHFDEDEYKPHPNDCSLVTFRGHRVLKTLIRCHFSPAGSTNDRYVYTGSEDGKVYIYNMDATLAGVVDVNKATAPPRPINPKTGRPNLKQGRALWKTCVRDASWHPYAPVIAGMLSPLPMIITKFIFAPHNAFLNLYYSSCHVPY
jgi:DDB1- and CUL4-associated factor 11